MSFHAVIWTEGKTDWQHLKRSFALLGAGDRIGFQEHQADFGDDNLLKQLNASAKEPHSVPTIFLFDRDTADIVAKVEEPGSAV